MQISEWKALISRDWLSSLHGHIYAEERVAGSLHVFGARYGWAHDAVGVRPLAEVRATESKLLLSSTNAPNPAPPPLRCYLSDSENLKRILWVADDKNRTVLETWDANLLDAAREAAAWLATDGDLMAPVDIDQALRRLSEPIVPLPYTVGLCTATKNQLWQLQRALPLNLLQTWPNRGHAKIHVVDCSSDDDTLEWLKTHCRAAIDIGLMVLYTVPSFGQWHTSIGKNCAHVVSREAILVNVDGNNLLGPDFPMDVCTNFLHGATVLQYKWGLGSLGRIAYSREDFWAINGYDEDAYPLGGEDIDLIWRLKTLQRNFRPVWNISFSQAISANQSLNVEHAAMKDANLFAFQEKLANGEIQRNLHKVEGIGLRVYKVRWD